MNRFAGLTGTVGKESEREGRLRMAFGNDQTDLTIISPIPGVSLAWCGNNDLTAVANTANNFALAHGSAYRLHGTNAPSIAVDNVHALAELLLERTSLGDALLDGLDGSFISVTGTRHGGFALAGDPSGNRAPYFSIENNELAFTNHPLVCARLLNKPQIDRGLEDFLLIYGFLPDGRTIYKGVHQLTPQTMLMFENGQCKHMPMNLAQQDTSYEEAPESEESLYDRLYDVLLGCMEDQLASTAEVGVLLGGFDSALVASLLCRLGKRVHTYSFHYADMQYNQPHTDTLSSYLGCKHSWINITPDVIATGLEQYAEHCVQPTNWLNYIIQTIHVCEHMRRDGIDYAYSGDGCDAVFLGYPGTYKRTRAFANLPQLPTGLIDILIRALNWPSLDRRIGHPYRVAMNLLRAMARPMPSRAFLTFRVMDEMTVKSLRKTNSVKQDETLESIVHRLAEPFTDLSIQRLGYAAKSLVSPNRTKLIASTDVTGVRVHTPYLHPTLRKFAATIPDHLLREQTQNALQDPGKICLSRMAAKHRLLPTEIIQQQKLAAIDSPIDNWFATELRPSLERAIKGLPFSTDTQHTNSLIETTAAEKFYKRYIGSTSVISDAISLLATYGAMAGALHDNGAQQ